MKNLKIIKFSAPWCGPCKALQPAIDAIKDVIEVVEYNIDDDDGQSLAKKMDVRAVPTIMLMDGDRLLKTSVGMTTEEELREWIDVS